MKVVRVTKTLFELEGNRVYEHPVELEKTPSLEEFQDFYDTWIKIFQEKFGKNHGKINNN